MEIEKNYPYSLESSPAISEDWDDKLAKWISWVFSPTALIVLGFWVIAYSIGTVDAWVWTIFFFFFSVVIKSIYILLKVKRGEITDFHMKVRRQRIQPMLLILCLSVIGWLILWIEEAPILIIVFAGAGCFQIAFLLFVTLRWKISGHSTAASAFSIFIFALFGRFAFPVLLLIPLMAWARVHRHRHEMLQTIAGSFAGGIYIILVLYLININHINLNL